MICNISTTSIYVHKLFDKMLDVKKTSKMQRFRFTTGHFVKYHGKMTKDDKLRAQDLNLRAEDMVCE